MNEEEHRYMRLSQAAAVVERLTGERPTVQTLHRWVHRGLAGVKLQPVYVGGIRRVSAAMLQQFFDEVTAAKTGATVAASEATPQGSGNIATEKAERELRDSGI